MIAKNFNKNRGFSLIEMLVSLALFATVVTTSIGTLLVLIDANAKSQSIQIAINNLSFATDSITRQIRTGTDFYCSNNLSSITTGGGNGKLRTGINNCTGGEAVAFTDNRTGDRFGFSLDGGVIKRKVDDLPSGPYGPWLDMTGDNLIITELDFVVTGTGNTDNEQPAVTVFITAEVGDATGIGTEFQIQNTVVQRKLDL